MGFVSLGENSGINTDPSFTLSAALPDKTLFLGFLTPIFCGNSFGADSRGGHGKGGCSETGTASSGALLLQGKPPPVENTPEPGSMVLLLTGLVGLGLIARHRRKS